MPKNTLLKMFERFERNVKVEDLLQNSKQLQSHRTNDLVSCKSYHSREPLERYLAGFLSSMLAYRNHVSRSIYPGSTFHIIVTYLIE